MLLSWLLFSNQTCCKRLIIPHTGDSDVKHKWHITSMVSLAFIWVKFEYGKLFVFFLLTFNSILLKLLLFFFLIQGNLCYHLCKSEMPILILFYFFYPNRHLKLINQSSTIEIKCSVLFIVKYEVHSSLALAGLNELWRSISKCSDWSVFCLLPLFLFLKYKYSMSLQLDISCHQLTLKQTV